jgi:acyl-CoA synthetase (AMP-forming)/AMP-acid ligase II
MRKWEMPRGADVIAEEGISDFTGIDTLLRDLLMLHAREGRTWPSLRVIAVAGDEALTRRIHPELGAEPSGVYGLTECTTNVALGDLREPREVRERHIGRPQPGLEVKIIDPETGTSLPPGCVGEITVRGWTVMEGYYRDEAATAAAFTEDGFVRTGDFGLLSEDGYLRFRGRLKLMIKSGGENVSLEEVESVLREHPAVADACVVPVPDERFAEVGWALLVLADETTSPADVERFARERLANFKVPKRFLVLPELPRTGSGKVDRTGLRRRYAEGAFA